jgi:hypothetical protein
MVDVPPNRFRVVLLWTAQQQLRDIAARAESRTIRRGFALSVQSILTQWGDTPATLGDPVKRFEAAGLLQFRWLHDRIVTKYAVDEVNKVYVQECFPVLDHPLASP